MTTFNTGNSVGSPAVKDLYDNSENLDEFVNSPSKTMHDDRLGVSRKTWYGMEQEFDADQAARSTTFQASEDQRESDFSDSQDDKAARFAQFLASSFYQPLGDYDLDGPLEITEYNQIFTKDGEFYRPLPSLVLPYTTLENWVTDEAFFTPIGDADLRQELAAENGVFNVGNAVAHVPTIADLRALTGLVDGQVVYTKGRTSVADGGAARYLWRAGSLANDGEHYYIPDNAMTGRWVFDGLISNPEQVGEPGTGEPLSNGNVMIGGAGQWDSSKPMRPAWDAVDGPEPTVGDNSLGLSGHYIDPANNSVVIEGGRPGYYSYTGPKASLSYTYGGDNYNGHLAGQIHGYHVDLIDDDLGNGDHGCVFGGSYKRVSGSYGGSFAGTVHDVHGLQSVAIGGRNIKIGSRASAIDVRRSGTLGGLSNHLRSGFHSAIIGGKGCTLDGDESVIAGCEDVQTDAIRAFAVSSRFSTVTATGACVIGGTFAVADVPGAITRSVGRNSVAGDSQTHYMELRRTSVGPNVFLSHTGGGGADIYTPPANTTGVATVECAIQKLDAGASVMAAYVISFAYSNIGGTLTIKGQSVNEIFADDPAYVCSALVAGAGTRLAVSIQTNGDVSTFVATGTARVIVNRVVI